MVGRDVAVDRATALADPVWRYVALGHIHKHQSLNRDEQPPIIYSGSPERIDFGEEREAKGWVVATIGEGQTIWRFQEQYRRPARPFRTIEVDVRDAEDPTARSSSGSERPATCRRRWCGCDRDAGRGAGAAAGRPGHQAGAEGRVRRAPIQRDVQRRERGRLGGVSVEALTPLQVLDRYLDTRNVDEARKKLLLQQAEDLMREVGRQGSVSAVASALAGAVAGAGGAGGQRAGCIADDDDFVGRRGSSSSPAFLVGLLLGAEREYHDKSAGMRTLILITRRARPCSRSFRPALRATAIPAGSRRRW